MAHQMVEHALLVGQLSRKSQYADNGLRLKADKLDGSRDRASLVRFLEWEVAEGRLDLVIDGKPVEPG